jgi:hypothetical protein
VSAQEKIDGAALFIYGAIQVDPPAFDLDISLIDAPGTAHRPGVPVPAFLELRDVALHPPQDGRVGYGDAAFGHHLDQVTRTELERQVLAHAKVR